MITKSKAFLTSNGEFYLTHQEAQESELCVLLKKLAPDAQSAVIDSLCEQIILKKDEVLAILSTRKVRVPKVKPARGNAAKANRAAVNAALQDSKQ